MDPDKVSKCGFCIYTIKATIDTGALESLDVESLQKVIGYIERDYQSGQDGLIHIDEVTLR